MVINEIFYSLQGEGRHTGTAAIFVRFSGCNQHCPFCDTQHTQGREMTVADICEAIKAFPSRHVILTGGEPSLQLTQELVDELHRRGYYIHVETNGSNHLPNGIDWITCSPKFAPVVLDSVHEIKLLFSDAESTRRRISELSGMTARERYLQPLDTQDGECNEAILRECVKFIKTNPIWKLSLQTHKIIAIP